MKPECNVLTTLHVQVNQLQHELSKKDELLRIVSIASEESETDSSCSTPLRFNESFSLSQGLLQLDMLHEKLRELEEENMALRSKVQFASLSSNALWAALGDAEVRPSIASPPCFRFLPGLAECVGEAGR
jgi:hypothetical protein